MAYRLYLALAAIIVARQVRESWDFSDSIFVRRALVMELSPLKARPAPAEVNGPVENQANSCRK